MEWVKLVAQPAFYLDAALLRAGEPAEVLFTRGLAYCGGSDTRGRIDKTVLPMIVGRSEQRALALVREGLWIDCGDHYAVRSWDRWQDEHDRAAAVRRGNRERQRRLRDRVLQDSRSEDPDVTRDVTVSSRVTSRAVSRDVTALEGEREGEREVLKTCSTPLSLVERSRFDEWWRVYPKRVGKQAARTTYDRLAKTVGHAALIEGAARYRDDPTRDPGFTAYPVTWLRAGRWEDEGPTRDASTTQGATTTDKVRNTLSLAEQYRLLDSPEEIA